MQVLSALVRSIARDAPVASPAVWGCFRFALFLTSMLAATPAMSAAPGAPTNLVAQGADAKVVLNWTAPSDDGGGALDGYNIYRCAEGQTACSPEYIAWVALADGTAYADSGVTADTEYRYAVGASRNSELSAWSNQVTVTAEDPGKPTALTARANEGVVAGLFKSP